MKQQSKPWRMKTKQSLSGKSVVLCSSQVERFGNTSFVVAHQFSLAGQPETVASGSEVRVWGYSDSSEPARLVARAMPDEVRAMLSVDKTIDVTV